MWAGVLLVSCGPARARPDCAQRCGLTAFGSGDCEDFSATVDECLAAYGRHVQGWSVEQTCRRLEGWRVFMRHTDGGSFTGADGDSQVAGQTWFTYASIEVSDLPWHRGALCHELGHLLEDRIDNRYDAAHARWHQNGIYDGIDEARRLGLERTGPDAGGVPVVR